MERCSLGHFHDGPCGSYSRYPQEQGLIKLSSCHREVKPHLRSVKVSLGGEWSGFVSDTSTNNILNEADLLCRRVGIFVTNQNLTVCPLHRYKLGVEFHQTKTCQSPGHTGKGKTFRGLSVAHSKRILEDQGIFLPVGSGICYQCHSKQSSIHTEDAPNAHTELLEEELEGNKGSNEYYSFRERSTANETSVEPVYDFSQSEVSSQQNGSQVSSWSEENESQSTLDHTNTFLSTFSISPIKYQVNTSLSDLADSSKRYLKRKSSEAVNAILSTLVPGQEREMLKMIAQQENNPRENQIDSEVIKTITTLYSSTQDNTIKIQLISLMSRAIKKSELLRTVPGVTTYKIDQARSYATQYKDGYTPIEKKGYKKMKMDPEKLEHALSFFFNPSFHQIMSYGTRSLKLESGQVLEIPDVVRTSCKAALIKMYDTFCKETDFQALSRATLFKILKVCAASQRTNMKGLDNIIADGHSAIEQLNSLFIIFQDNGMDIEKAKELENLLNQYKVYLKAEYKVHISEKSEFAHHCIPWSLSDPQDPKHQTKCDHQHHTVCERCETWETIKGEISSFISEHKLSETNQDFQLCVSRIEAWKSHIMRTVAQDKCRLSVLDQLMPSQSLIILDWAMKFLPIYYREKQSDWFGQKGLNWHVAVCIFKTADNELKHKMFTHIMDGAKQDWFAVSSLIEHLLKTLKSQMPHIDEVYLRSDNAGCYHCAPLWLSLFDISERTEIQIKQYDYSEAQAGKSYCDSKIAHMRGKIRTYAASGHNVITADDMKKALDSGTGVVGCQTAVVKIDTQSQNITSHKMKGINKITNVCFETEGVRLFHAYDVGEGHFIPKADFQRLGNDIQGPTNLIILSDFSSSLITLGRISKPSISKESQTNQQCQDSSIQERIEDQEADNEEDSSNVFLCTEPGCAKIYQTYSGFENHIITGRHVQHSTVSTYDKVRSRWADNCQVMASNTLPPLPERRTERRIEAPITNMGWALKAEKKSLRHPDSVKKYLDKIFQEGQTKGTKANPHEVARKMRTAKNDKGELLFSTEEWLQPSQISSFFSRLATINKHLETTPTRNVQRIEVVTDDAAFESIMMAINESEIISELNNEF